ncbi:MAG: amidohydrolase family protein [Clostridia bacterium]|nr:amidohydrolase family protein [Clostridia bacterium]
MRFEERFALMNVSVIDGNGGDIINDAAVVINGKKIEKVCPALEVTEPELQKIDLKGKYVMPGLIDAHVHLTGVPDFKYWGLVEPAAAQANSYTQALKMLKHGFTGIRDISENGLFLKRAFRVPGVIGPRIVACGRGLNRTGGHCDGIHFDEFGFEDRVNFIARRADGEDEIRTAIRSIIRQGADQIKFWATGGGHNMIDRFRDVHYTREEITAICKEAKLIDGMRVVAHCEDPDLSAHCIEAGTDSIEHADGYSPEIADLMLEHGTYYIPTMRLLVNWQSDYMDEGLQHFEQDKLGPFFQMNDGELVDPPDVTEDFNRMIIELFQDAVDRGIRIGMGSDTIWENMTPYGEYSVLEMMSMQKYGMTAKQVITAATKTNAGVLGLEDVLGTVEEGKYADLLVLGKDPTRDVGVFREDDLIEYIFRDGKLAMDHGMLKV